MGGLVQSSSAAILASLKTQTPAKNPIFEADSPEEDAQGGLVFATPAQDIPSSVLQPPPRPTKRRSLGMDDSSLAVRTHAVGSSKLQT